MGAFASGRGGVGRCGAGRGGAGRCLGSARASAGGGGVGGFGAGGGGAGVGASTGSSSGGVVTGSPSGAPWLRGAAGLGSGAVETGAASATISTVIGAFSSLRGGWSRQLVDSSTAIPACAAITAAHTGHSRRTLLLRSPAMASRYGVAAERVVTSATRVSPARLMSPITAMTRS